MDSMSDAESGAGLLGVESYGASTTNISSGLLSSPSFLPRALRFGNGALETGLLFSFLGRSGSCGGTGFRRGRGLFLIPNFSGRGNGVPGGGSGWPRPIGSLGVPAGREDSCPAWESPFPNTLQLHFLATAVAVPNDSELFGFSSEPFEEATGLVRVSSVSNVLRRRDLSLLIDVLELPPTLRRFSDESLAKWADVGRAGD